MRSTPTATATATAEGPSEKTWKAEVTALCKDNERAARRVVGDAHAEGIQGKKAVAEVLGRSVRYERRRGHAPRSRSRTG